MSSRNSKRIQDFRYKYCGREVLHGLCFSKLWGTRGEILPRILHDRTPTFLHGSAHVITLLLHVKLSPLNFRCMHVAPSQTLGTSSTRIDQQNHVGCWIYQTPQYHQNPTEQECVGKPQIKTAHSAFFELPLCGLAATGSLLLSK